MLKLDVKRGGDNTYPRSFILAARDEVGLVGAELQIRNDVHMRALIVRHLVAGLHVEERYLARLVTREDLARSAREGADGRF